MSRFKAIVPLVNSPFQNVPNIFSATTDDDQDLVTSLGYINDLAYRPNITTPAFVSPPIPLLKPNDILYIISSDNTIKLFGVYFVDQVGQSFQLFLNQNGGNFQPHSEALDSISELITEANQMIYTTAPNTYAVSDIDDFSRTLLALTSALDWRAALGLGTAAVQNVTSFLQPFNNLLDVQSIATSRTNLGLGNAATKAVSDNTKATVASINGTTVVNNVAAFNDTTGTIKDSGMSFAGLVPSSRTLTAQGLVTGGGNLTADRNFTVTAALQADQQTATSNILAVTPVNQIYNPTSIKARGTLNEGGSPSWLDQYNFTTIVRNGTADYTLTMAVTFANTNYQVIILPSSTATVQINVSEQTTSSFRISPSLSFGASDRVTFIMVTGTLA